MGYWGYFPCDGDGAWDFFGKVCDRANEYIEELFKKRIGQCRWRASFLFDRAGIVLLLLQKGFHINLRFVRKAIEYLNIALKDTEWHKMASDPKEAKRQIVLVRNAMKELIQSELKRKTLKLYMPKELKEKLKRFKKGCVPKKERAITAPHGWLQREWEKPGASWTGCTEIHRLLQEKKGI